MSGKQTGFPTYLNPSPLVQAIESTLGSELLRSVAATPAKPPSERSEMFRSVQKCSETFNKKENCKTKPTAHFRGISPRHLAAARALVRGLSVTRVATMLNTTSQTINRWRRTPEFAAELRRLHEGLALGTLKRSDGGLTPSPPRLK